MAFMYCSIRVLARVVARKRVVASSGKPNNSENHSDSFIQACSITRGIKEVPSALISRSLSSLSSCASRFWCLNIRSRTLARRVRFCPHTWAKALITCSSFRRTSWKTSHIICWNEFYNKQLLIIIYLYQGY